VGVVGYHLGGGASPILGRAHGYAADHIQTIEIVTADGELRRVAASSEPDLFWALRGGKGNFGVVTTLEFALFPVKRFDGGGLVAARAVRSHVPR
jgi:FAD/FMN-containing dehydrogenase